MTIIPREDYDHPGPLGPSIDLSRVTGWDIHHTAGPLDETPFSIADSTRRKWGRSSYNFLVSQVHRPDHVHEMQGLHIGAHNDGENSTRLGIVLPGYYHPPRNHRPSSRQQWTVAWLMAYGHDQWGIPIHAKGHRDSDATACPGDYLQARIADIVATAKEINDMADHQHPHPDPDKFPFDGAEDEFARLLRDGIYTRHTPKGGLVTTASNAVYLDALLDEIARLRKRVSDLESNDSSGESGLTLAEIRADIANRIGG